MIPSGLWRGGLDAAALGQRSRPHVTGRELSRYLDELIVAAARQGWAVHQRRTGVWQFRKAELMISQRVNTTDDMVVLVSAMRGAGLVLGPPEGREPRPAVSRPRAAAARAGREAGGTGVRSRR